MDFKKTISAQVLKLEITPDERSLVKKTIELINELEELEEGHENCKGFFSRFSEIMDNLEVILTDYPKSIHALAVFLDCLEIYRLLEELDKNSPRFIDKKDEYTREKVIELSNWQKSRPEGEPTSIEKMAKVLQKCQQKMSESDFLMPITIYITAMDGLGDVTSGMAVLESLKKSGAEINTVWVKFLSDVTTIQSEYIKKLNKSGYKVKVYLKENPTEEDVKSIQETHCLAMGADCGKFDTVSPPYLTKTEELFTSALNYSLHPLGAGIPISNGHPNKLEMLRILEAHWDDHPILQDLFKNGVPKSWELIIEALKDTVVWYNAVHAEGGQRAMFRSLLEHTIKDNIKVLASNLEPIGNLDSEYEEDQPYFDNHKDKKSNYRLESFQSEDPILFLQCNLPKECFMALLFAIVSSSLSTPDTAENKEIANIFLSGGDASWMDLIWVHYHLSLSGDDRILVPMFRIGEYKQQKFLSDLLALVEEQEEGCFSNKQQVKGIISIFYVEDPKWKDSFEDDSIPGEFNKEFFKIVFSKEFQRDYRKLLEIIINKNKISDFIKLNQYLLKATELVAAQANSTSGGDDGTESNSTNQA